MVLNHRLGTVITRVGTQMITAGHLKSYFETRRTFC